MTSQHCVPIHRTINVATYPEENPFDGDPPVYNVTPFTAAYDMAFDTAEFRAAALAMAQSSGVNPLRWQYCSNPFADIHRGEPIPFKRYTPPPPLSEVTLPNDTVFLKQIHGHCKTVLITLRIAGEVRLLKIVRLLSFAIFLGGDLRCFYSFRNKLSLKREWTKTTITIRIFQW
jgi:hypothetical protein